MTTDEQGNLWFAMTTGDRDASVLRICGVAATGESVGCFEPLGGLEFMDLHTMVVHEGHVYLDPRFPEGDRTIQVCEVPLH